MRKPLIAGLLIAVGLVAGPALWAAGSDEKPAPQRADISVGVTKLPPTALGTVGENPLVIEESNILSVQIPSVAIDIKVSGETMPRESPRCHGSTICIDPPVMTEAAWYGAYSRPALPSTDTVLMYGHSNWNNTDEQVFNDLPAVVQGDLVTLTTATGVFTYSANTPMLVDYDQIAMSELVYGHVPDRVVFVTCNDKESAATVVTADLVHAVPR